MQDADFRTGRGKIRINAGAVRTCENSVSAGWACIEATTPPSTRPARKREPHNRRALQYVPLAAEGAPCVRKHPPSVVDALSLAARLPGRRRGGLPARVRNAEAAVARNHLLHAQLEGWEGAILVHGPSGDFRQCAPRPLVGLACTRIEGDGRCQSSRNQDDSHGGLRGLAVGFRTVV
jgi:hypothetical protein